MYVDAAFVSRTIAEGSSPLAPPVVVLAGVVVVELEVFVGAGTGATAGTFGVLAASGIFGSFAVEPGSVFGTGVDVGGATAGGGVATGAWATVAVTVCGLGVVLLSAA